MAVDLEAFRDLINKLSVSELPQSDVATLLHLADSLETLRVENRNLKDECERLQEEDCGYHR